MTFETIYIKSFGKLSGKTFSFSEGINIIEGENESGKSTICAFIQFIFYGLPSKTQEKLRYISWDTSMAAGSITVKDATGRYRIEREVICATSADGKTSFREKCVVYDAETNLVAFKGKIPGERFFGVSSSVFENTVYIRQTKDAKIGGASLGEEAENILFSGNEKINTGKALSKLESARVFLLHKNHKGGKISDLEDTKERLEETLESAKKSNADIIYLEGSHRQISEKKAASEARLATVEAELNEYERYTVKKTCALRKAEKERLGQTEEKLATLKNPPEHAGIPVASPEYIEMLEEKQYALAASKARYADVKKKLDEANEKISNMSEKLAIFERFGAKDGKRRDALVANMEHNQKQMKKCQTLGVLFAVLALFSVILALISRMVSTLPEILKYLSVTGCLLFLAAAVYFIFLKKGDYARDIQNQCKHFNCKGYAEFKELVKAASEDEAYMLFIRGTRDEINEKFTLCSDELDEINAEILHILREARFEISENTSVSLTEALEKCRILRTEIIGVEAIADEQRRSLESIEADLSDYTKEDLKSAYYAEYDEEAMENFNLLAKKKDFEFLTGAIATQTERLHQIELELASLRAINTDPTEIAEELSATEEEIETLTKKWSAYMLAIESIHAASGKLREGISPKIAKNAGKLLGVMTEGKYEEIALDTDFLLSFSDGSMMRDAEFLSAGTGDLAYICLRIALIELLYQKTVPPFIFDESFVRIDDARMKNVLSLVRKYADHEYQTLIFTCHKREKDAMDAIGPYHLLSI